MNTSLRGHGKWGDFLVALVPLSWCGNILVNSNFILRMIEWQNESSLFTLRVQGKQWYWVYKFDSTILEKLQNRPINLGHNKWVMLNLRSELAQTQQSDLGYLSAQLEFQKMYTDLIKDNQFTQVDLNNQLYPGVSYITSITPNSKNISVNINTNYWHSGLDDTSNFAANMLVASPVKALHISKGILNTHVVEVLQESLSVKPLFFKAIYTQPAGSVVEKTLDTEFFWGFRQKKYKRLKAFNFNKVVLQNRGLRLLLKTVYNNYQGVKFNKQRSELVPVTLARRLLRTKRTLVLPAHVNLTVITNSYDVVHSWFIPGLGLKLDCVPGRSTHHTFYIDNIGFYYGQCAEICGRYHHHMPIRLCALPLEHFIVWWEHKGLHRHLRY